MNNLHNESIAYALAAGLIAFDDTASLDRQIERDRRRARQLRNVARGNR